MHDCSPRMPKHTQRERGCFQLLVAATPLDDSLLFSWGLPLINPSWPDWFVAGTSGPIWATVLWDPGQGWQAVGIAGKCGAQRYLLLSQIVCGNALLWKVAASQCLVPDNSYSSSPVPWLWNQVTQIWMETIANISPCSLWNKHLPGLSAGYCTNCKWFWLSGLCHLFQRSGKQSVCHRAIHARSPGRDARWGFKWKKTSVERLRKTRILTCRIISCITSKETQIRSRVVGCEGNLYLISLSVQCSWQGPTSFAQTTAQFRNTGHAANIWLGCGCWSILAQRA